MADAHREYLAGVLERIFGSFLAHDPHNPQLFWGDAADRLIAAEASGPGPRGEASEDELDAAIADAKRAAGLDPDRQYFPGEWIEHLPARFASSFWTRQVQRALASKLDDASDDVGPEGTWPADHRQFAARWNRWTPEQRDEFVTAAYTAQAIATNCRIRDHAGQIAHTFEHAQDIRLAALEVKALIDAPEGVGPVATPATIRAATIDLLRACGVWADAPADTDERARRQQVRAGSFPEISWWLNAVENVFADDVRTYLPIGDIESAIAKWLHEPTWQDLQDRTYGALQVLRNSGKVELAHARGYRWIGGEPDADA